jgi:hypothetical protein
MRALNHFSISGSGSDIGHVGHVVPKPSQLRGKCRIHAFIN